jgi:hypothetical protein
MRLLLLSALILLPACASVADPDPVRASDFAPVTGAEPALQAAAQADSRLALEAGQLRDIRNLEARLDLARARLDYSALRRGSADEGDVREFLDARRALRDARNVFGPTDTGYRDVFSVPLWGWGHDRAGRWPDSRPRRLDGSGAAASDVVPNGGGAMPLSSLKR